MVASRNFENQLRCAMLRFPLTIKEPFLLVFSSLWTAVAFLPAGFYRRRNGEPYDDLLFRRIAFAGIGLALLLAWYALPFR
jgi:hypothetical protein